MLAWLCRQQYAKAPFFDTHTRVHSCTLYNCYAYAPCYVSTNSADVCKRFSSNVNQSACYLLWTLTPITHHCCPSHYSRRQVASTPKLEASVASHNWHTYVRTYTTHLDCCWRPQWVRSTLGKLPPVPDQPKLWTPTQQQQHNNNNITTTTQQ